MKNLFTYVFVFLFVFSLHASASKKMVWPGPPAEPRIAFDQVIQKAEDLQIKKGFFSKMFDFVFGDEEKVLIKPFGIHIGIDDKIYVTDTGASALFIFDKKNNKLKIINGSKKQKFVSPIDVKTDNGNIIYVADSVLKKIFTFSQDGKFLGYFAKDFDFKRPTGLVMNNVKETIYVSDTLNSTLEVFNFQGKHIETIGKYGDQEMEFNSPTFLAIDNDENIYVSDSMNQRIQIFDTNHKFIRTFGEMGKVPGTFANPRGIAVDKDGNIFVSDTLFNTIQIFNNKGQLLMLFGQEGMKRGSFEIPAGIAIKNGKIFIADSYNMRIQKFSLIKYEK